MKFKIKFINDLEKVYSILKEKYPKHDIKINQINDYFIVEVNKCENNNENNNENLKLKLKLNIKVVYGDTDSIMCKFNFVNRIDYIKNREDTFKLATLAGDLITANILNRKPLELEFEKVFQPFILLTKKRYIANKYENMKDPFCLKGVDSKGIATTRRDYCLMVKNCYNNIIDSIVNEQDYYNKQDILNKGIDIFKKYLNDIILYKIKIDDLIVSALLKKEYSCSLCKNKVEWIQKCNNKMCNHVNIESEHCCIKCKKTKYACIHKFSLPHVSLASKLIKREKEVNVNDRIQYIYVELNQEIKKKSKGELSEDPGYANENNLKFNRICYIEQLSKPILGFFKAVLDTNDISNLLKYVNNILTDLGGNKIKLSDVEIDDD